MARCSICKKRAKSGSNVSHAQNRTKRKFRPNLQKVNGIILCSKCIKTIKKINREKIAQLAEAEKKKSEVEDKNIDKDEKNVDEKKVEKSKKSPTKKTTKTAKK